MAGNRMVRHNFPARDRDYVTNRDSVHDLNPDTEENCWCGPQVLMWEMKDNGRKGWVTVVEGIGMAAFDGSMVPEGEPVEGTDWQQVAQMIVDADGGLPGAVEALRARAEEIIEEIVGLEANLNKQKGCPKCEQDCHICINCERRIRHGEHLCTKCKMRLQKEAK